MSPELEALQRRVGNGIDWLTEHDLSGAFHLWFEAGLTRISPMPAQDEDRRAAWQAYYAARVTFERLERECAALEKTEGYVLPEPA